MTSDETHLVHRIRNGDGAAFDQLVRIHYRDLFDFALTLVRIPAIAEDVIQDVLLNVWERRAGWQPIPSPRAYLFAAVRNRAYNALRDRRKFAEPDPDEPSAFASDELARYHDLVRDYRLAIGDLPDRRREVYRLSRLYGLTYDEIAAVLDISPNTVRSQMAAALKHLRRRLIEYLSFIW